MIKQLTIKLRIYGDIYITIIISSAKLINNELKLEEGGCPPPLISLFIDTHFKSKYRIINSGCKFNK